MKFLVLGGGNCQLNLIKKIKSLGHTVIVSDYYDDAPGKALCDIKSLTSTFDIEANISLAKKYNIDAVVTAGTDQPVFTAAKVAKATKIPFALSVSGARNVTNKKYMKELFVDNNIPTNEFVVIDETFNLDQISHLRTPLVIKPLDSQGQRGVLKLDSYDDIKKNFSNVLSFSRVNEILVEEYYPSDEITVSGWVCNGTPYILTVTDRVTYCNYPNIGICTAHNFPSKYFKRYNEEILSISNKIVKSFKIENGPIYFQMLIGNEGIKVNEIACRLGGAYEDISIPYLTGIDILQLLIDSSLGKTINEDKLKKYSLDNNLKLSSVQLLFSDSGTVSYITKSESINKLPGVIDCNYSISEGSKIEPITNATQRIGYAVISGESPSDLNTKIKNVFDNIKILDNKNKNLIINFNNYSTNYYK
ncbi:hypothetical protein SH2C18_11540 [Clostridium sediminicola]|uniref:ATP-grasp domain-containing protein n=1 Tax=Clostridium sediminicola TaxID=3114879 RepID=UPI0031F22374